MDMSTQAERAGRRADDSEWMDHAVRIGLVSYGVVHLIIAWLAVRLVFGDSGRQRLQQGSAAPARRDRRGPGLLVRRRGGLRRPRGVAGARGGLGAPRRGGRQRRAQAAGVCGEGRLYGTLAVSVVPDRGRLVRSGGGGTDGLTAQAHGLPGGPLIVGAVGVGDVVVAGVPCSTGRRRGVPLEARGGGPDRQRTAAPTCCSARSATSPRRSPSRSWACSSSTPRTHDPEKSGGLDEALQKLLQQPFGGRARPGRPRLRLLRLVLFRLGTAPRPIAVRRSPARAAGRRRCRSGGRSRARR